MVAVALLGLLWLVGAEERTIIDETKVFSSINEGNALAGWPSEEIKTAAGKNGWGDWKPAGGMKGEVLKSWGKRHLLKFKSNVDGEEKSRFAVISEAGLLGDPEPKGHTLKETTEIRKIIDVKKIFSTINKGDTLQGWPSEKIKAGAGADGWGDWTPEVNMVGEVLKSWGNRHLLRVVINENNEDDKFLVISEAGLEGDPKPAEEAGAAGDAESDGVSEGSVLESAEVVEDYIVVVKGSTTNKLAWLEYKAFLGEGNDVHEDDMEVDDAFEYCRKSKECRAFTFDAQGKPDAGTKHVWFKSDKFGSPVADPDGLWRTYVKPSTDEADSEVQHEEL